MNRHLPFFLLLFLLPFSGIRAQYNDAGLWINAGVEKKITRGLSASLSGELRMNENITEAGTFMADLGLQYRFGKRFRIGAAYRFTMKRRPDDTYALRNGWYFDGIYREKFRPVTLLFRLRLQSRYAEPYTSEMANIPVNHLRGKLTLKYDLKKPFEPYVSAEAFFRLGTPEYRPLDQLRFTAGIEYTINRHHMVDLHYLINKEVNVSNPETDWVIGIDYCYTF